MMRDGKSRLVGSLVRLWLRLQADGVYGDHTVGVTLAGLGLCIDVMHAHERLGGCVAVLQVLEDGAAELVLALLRYIG